MLKNLNLVQKKNIPKEGMFVGLLGLEPRTTEPKSAVLPLHHRPIKLAITNIFCLNIASANVVQKNKIARKSSKFFKKNLKEFINKKKTLSL